MAQASKQMLTLYEKIIGMIEELEKCEGDRDLTEKIEATLSCLLSQMRAAPSEETEETKREMLERKMRWEAARKKKGIPRGPVDDCADRVVQSIKQCRSSDGRTGNSKHAPTRVQGFEMTEEQMELGSGDDDDPRGQCQELVQVQRQRSLQASKQMLHGIYENTIGMIEELEKHEDHGKSAGNSGLLSAIIPKDKKKDKEDVIAIIETELSCLRAQMKYAPPEIAEEAKKEMIERTLRWVAAREEREIPIGLADHYAKNVVQLLIGQSMKKKSVPGVTGWNEHTANRVLYNVAKARQQVEQQDKDFHDNPNKEAVMREMRHGQNYHDGRMRLLELEEDDDFRAALFEKCGDAPSL